MNHRQCTNHPRVIVQMGGRNQLVSASQQKHLKPVIQEQAVLFRKRCILTQVCLVWFWHLDQCTIFLVVENLYTLHISIYTCWKTATFNSHTDTHFLCDMASIIQMLCPEKLPTKSRDLMKVTRFPELNQNYLFTHSFSYNGLIHKSQE